MAINFATDAKQSRLAILMNQAFFGVGAPTAAQLEAQIDYLQTYTAIFNGNEILAVQELVRGTLAFPQNANKTLAQLAADTWLGVVGRAATAEEVAFLVNAYSPFGANARTLLVSNIIVQYANDPKFIPGLDEFTLEVQAGTADLTKNALVAPSDVKIDGLSIDNVREDASNGELIGTLTAIDANSTESQTFKLLKIDGVAATGSNAEVFRLDGNKVVVNNEGALDFETKTSHIIEVQATDQTGRSTTKILVVNVGNVGPEGLNLSGTTVAEGEAVGTIIGAIAPIDNEANGPYTFEIQPGANAAKFKIVGNELQTADVLDFETTPGGSLLVDIKVTDGLGESKIQTVNISVTNLPGPTDVKIDGAAIDSIDENSANGSIVGLLSAVDADNNVTSFEIVGGSGAAVFKLSADGKSVIVADSSKLDAETTSSFTLDVKATDAIGESVTKTLTVKVNDLEEGKSIALTALAEPTVGTQDNDTFVANIFTLNAGDTIDGLDGANTLRYGDNTGFQANGFLTKNVQTLEVQGDKFFGANIDVTGMAGLTSVRNVNSAANVLVSGLTAGLVDLALTNVTGGDTKLVYDAPVIAGANDVQKITLTDVNDLLGKAASSILIAGVETFDIKVVGPQPSNLVDIDKGSPQLDKVLVSGDGFLEVVNPIDNLSLFDASTNTGGVKVTLANLDDGAVVKGSSVADDILINGALPPTKLTVEMGGGDDVLKINAVLPPAAAVSIDMGAGNDLLDLENAGTLSPTHVLNGGAGTNDRLWFKDFTQIPHSPTVTQNPASPVLDVTNFEVAKFSAAVGGANIAVASATLDASQLDGVRTFDLAGGVTNTQVAIAGLQKDQTHTVIIANNATAVLPNLAFLVEQTNLANTSQFLNDDGTKDKIIVDMNDLDLDVNSLAGPEIDAYEWQIANGSTNTVKLGGPQTDLTEFKLTGGNGAATFTFDGQSNLVQPGFLYDGSTSAAHQVVSGVNLGTVKTGSGNDTVTGTDEANIIITDGGTDNVNGKAGNDKIDLGTGNDKATGGRGNDTILGGADNDTLTGDTGDDVLDGGTGQDKMTGGGASAPTTNTVTVGGLIGFQDTFQIKVDANGDGFNNGVGGDFQSAVIVAAANQTAGQIATALQGSLAGAAGPGFTVTVLSDTITISEDDGTGFKIVTKVQDGAFLDGAPNIDVASVKINNALNYDQFDELQIVIQGPGGPETQNFIVPADGTTADQIATNLAAQFNNAGNPTNMFATAAGNVISFTGKLAGVDYTVQLKDFVPTFGNDDATNGIDNIEPVPGQFGFEFTDWEVGETLTVGFTGGDSWTYKRQGADATGEDAFISWFNNDSDLDTIADGVEFVTLLGLDPTQIPFDFFGPSATNGHMHMFGLADGSPSNVAQTALIIASITGGDGGAVFDINEANHVPASGTVNANGAPTVANPALAPPADDNTQALTVAPGDPGEVKGSDTFIANSPDVDPNNLVGDAIDLITDFDGNDKIAFDNATIAGLTAGPVNHLFDGVTTFGDVGNYTNAFGVANAILGSTAAIEYVQMRVGGDSFVFADTNGDNIADQAVQLVGVVGPITNTQIIADPNPVV